MPKLMVMLHGKEIASTELVPGEQYMAGRDSDCDIRLPGKKGISRQHVKFYWHENSWVAELVSRYGAMICEGESVEAVELQNDTSFSVPPYEFVFHDELASENVELGNDASLVMDEQALVPTGQELSADNRNFDTDPSDTVDPDDATDAGVRELIAQLSVAYSPESEVDEVIKLDGNRWVIGRGGKSDIVLRDDHISRQHFELNHTNDGYFLTDLGSANGTQLNGQDLEPKSPQPLSSGDVITIMDVTIRFELHDPNFDANIVNLPAPVVAPPMHAQPGIFPPPTLGYPQHAGPRAIKVDDDGKRFDLKKFDFKKNKVRIAIALMIPVIIYGVLKDSPKKTEQKDLSSTPGISFDKLAPEQKAVVKDTFNLAKSHYLKGKYELCNQEVRKLHGIIPFYENSKELETLCTQALSLEQYEREREQQQLELERTEQKIQMVTANCREKMTNTMTLTELEDCLAPAIELNPEHPSIVDLRSEVELRAQQRNLRQQELQARRQKIKEGEKRYFRAQALHKKGQLRRSIKAYKKYLARSYPDPQGYKRKAQRELASIESKLNQKVKSLLVVCQKGLEESKYKDALTACSAAIKEDPSNSEAKELRKRVKAELNREMKLLYQDSVLEESVGNVESAKAKWKEILSKDVPNGDFYRRAKRQLKKYGAGY